MKTTDRNGRTHGNGDGTRRPQEIQAEIERTRRQMDGTLSAIENRLTPGQLYDQGIQYLRNNGGTEFLSNLGEQAKTNPMPVALVGIGLAWLMATQKVGSNAKANLGATSRTGPGLKEKAYEAKARLSETASAIGDRAAGMRDTARGQIDRARSGLDTMMREQPLALGALGLAIGALAAALTPRTPQEERIAARIDEMAKADVTGEPARASSSLSADPMKKARDEERERLQQGVMPYAERAQSEPPV